MESSRQLILETEGEKALRRLSYFRQKYGLEITTWRKRMNNHLQSIEQKLRRELDEVHYATHYMIKGSLQKYANSDISLQEIENELRLHIEKYKDGFCDKEAGKDEQEVTKKLGEEIHEQSAEKFEKRTGTNRSESPIKQARDTGPDNKFHDVDTNSSDKISKDSALDSENPSAVHAKAKEKINKSDVTSRSTDTSKENENNASVISIVNFLRSLEYGMEFNSISKTFITDISSLGSCSLQSSSGKGTYYDNINDLLQSCKAKAISHPVLQNASVIRPKDDKKVPGHESLILGGAAMTADDSILLTDKSRQMLVECDTDGVIMREVQMALKPMTFTFINDYEVAIIYNGGLANSTVQILGTEDFEVCHEFEVSAMCKDLRYSDGKFYLACEYKVLVLNYYGDVIDKIHMQNACIRYLCVDNHQRVYFTNWNTNTLHCVGSGNKQEVYTYKHPDLRGATSVEIDGLDNCYVLGYISKNIHKLNPGGELLEIILSGGDGLCEPRVIAFHPCRSVFMVLDNSPECDFKIYRSAADDSEEDECTNMTTKSAKDGNHEF